MLFSRLRENDGKVSSMTDDIIVLDETSEADGKVSCYALETR